MIIKFFKFQLLLTLILLPLISSCATSKTKNEPLLKEEKQEEAICIDFSSSTSSSKNSYQESAENKETDDSEYIEIYTQNLPKNFEPKDITQISKENFENNIKEAKGKRDFQNSITNYTFEDGKVYSLIISTNMISDIRLEEGEIPTGDIVLSDIDNYMIDTCVSNTQTKQVYHIFIRANGATSPWSIACLPTNKRIYYFKLIPTDDIGMLAIKFNYPNKGVKTTSISYLNNNELCDLKNLNFNYVLSGDKTIKPIAVFSDNKSTYIQFTSDFLKNSYSPALYLQSKNGLTIINYVVKGNMYITNFILEKGEYFVLLQDKTRAEIKRGTAL